MSEDTYVGPLADRIAEWADRLIAPYLRLHPNPPQDRKQIHDPLCRIIELEPWEVYLVDSPVFQRLRYIRQLGVGQFLFPTAGYSRFEHSLGAMQVATMMFDSVVSALRQSVSGRGPAHSDDLFRRQRTVVRLAALVHDIGHCVFSHVSERFYQRYPDLLDAQQFYKRQFQQGGVSASETLSLLIVQSPAFLKLLKEARVQNAPSEEQLAGQIMMCVSGSIDRLAPNSYMAEIVNGFVDCDKLDYLSRDAHMAGVPIPLDTTRLLSKLRIAVKKKAGEDDKYTLAIVPSGMRALDELQVARIFLYDKFYYHQKIMASEELIRRALTYLSESVPQFRDPATLLEFGDDELFAVTPRTVEARFGASRDDPNVIRGCELLWRVRNRDLPKRVFAMANRFIPDPPEVLGLFYAEGGSAKTKELNVDFYQMSQRLSSSDSADMYRNEIAAFAQELGTETEIYVAHQAAGRAAGSMYLPVLRADNKLDERPKYLFPNDYWSEAYATNKATSYVFADNPTADAFLAAEREFADRWNLWFDRSSWVTAKVSEDLISARRATLPSDWRGFRLPPDFLDSPKTQLRIEQLKAKFASFLSAFDAKLGPQLIEAWVAQFADSDLRDSALRLLEHMTYVGPETLATAFENFAEGDPAMKSAIWVPFRAKKGPGESADQLSVDLKDITVKNQHVSTLTAEEVAAAGCVVFYDDTLNSGVQSTCRLTAWFGGDQRDCDHPDDWDQDGALPEAVQQALRKVPIVFAVYAKHPTGDSRLRSAAKKLGIDLVDVRGVVDSGLPNYTLDGFTAESTESRSRFMDELKKIGRAILRPKVGKRGWTDERVDKSALGYSEISLSIVFRHSISTSTPVALWGLSRDYESPWMPVLPRDKKQLQTLLRGNSKASSEPLPEYQGH
jgi:deoxynucleoside triphosphate triphosphohydrolase SAMHD1